FGDSSIFWGIGPAASVGYVMPSGPVDLSLGFDGRMVFWLFNDELSVDNSPDALWSLDPHLFGRIGKATGSVRPFARLTFGPEMSSIASSSGFFNRTGFAMNLDLGTQLDAGAV